jgi:RNA polymerase sigma-70 factor (ECF subfamily)
MGVSNETARHHTARREVMEAVYDALPGLSKMQRQCFELRYFHDLSVAEVAEVAGCSEGSVKQHLFRAANKLRDSLDHMRPMLEAGVLSAHED